MTDEPSITECFGEIVALATRAGAPAPITQLPGCWEYQVDARWFVALNGHSTVKTVERNGFPVEVQPFTCFVEYNGWPAGIVAPFDGIIAAGECANEDTFIEALKAAAR